MYIEKKKDEKKGDLGYAVICRLRRREMIISTINDDVTNRARQNYGRGSDSASSASLLGAKIANNYASYKQL